MDKNAKVALHFSRTVEALIELEAMKTANKEREMRGESLAYSEEAFMDLRKNHIAFRDDTKSLLG